MESSILEEEKIIKGVRNNFRLKKEIDDTTIKYIRNLFRSENKIIKERIIRDIKMFLRMRKNKIIINQ